MFSWLKKYFFPHSENNYKPHLLRYESTIIVLLLIIVIELGFLVQVFVVLDKTSFLASVLPGVLTSLTNEERLENNASPLIENDLLKKAAELKAQDMANSGYFAHTSPDGKTPWYWLDQVGYRYSMAGENLAVNFFESRDVAEAWMDSPTHRANIVKKNYTEIGIGVASGKYQGRNTVFVAQFFGTPISSTPTTTTSPTQPLQPTTKEPSTNTTKPIPTTKPKTPNTPPPSPTTPPTNTPLVNPRAVAVTPATVQVLGEETDSVVAPENITLISYIKFLVEKVLSSPREYVNYIYGGIALIIFLVVFLAVFIKREFEHPVIVARGLAIVVILVIFSIINASIFHIDPQIPSEGIEASVIAY